MCYFVSLPFPTRLSCVNEGYVWDFLKVLWQREVQTVYMMEAAVSFEGVREPSHIKYSGWHPTDVLYITQHM